MSTPKAKKVTKKEKPAVAVITIKDAARMTPAGRHEISKWLRRMGEALETNGKKYSKQFVARYIPR